MQCGIPGCLVQALRCLYETGEPNHLGIVDVDHLGIPDRAVHGSAVERVGTHWQHGYPRRCLNCLEGIDAQRGLVDVPFLLWAPDLLPFYRGTKLDGAAVRGLLAQFLGCLGHVQTRLELTTLLGHGCVHDWCHGFQALAQTGFLLFGQVM